jgi:hypothetical protein
MPRATWRVFNSGMESVAVGIGAIENQRGDNLSRSKPSKVRKTHRSRHDDMTSRLEN